MSHDAKDDVSRESDEFKIPHGNFRALFDYKTVIEMRGEGCDFEEISDYVEASPNMISRFIIEYESFDEEISIPWANIMHRLWELECERCSLPQEDYLLKLLRSSFNDYIFNPEILVRPTIDDVDWVYNQLIEKEKIEKLYTEKG